MHEIKVFFNNSFIKITNNFTLSSNKNRDFYSYDKNFDWSSIINCLLNSKPKKEILVLTHELEKSFVKFKQNFKTINAAGGIVLNENNELLVINRFGKWDLPKGKIEDGEKPHVAAIREVTEECGINNLNIISFACFSHHIYQHNAETILKTTFWYNMTCKKQTPTPQVSESIVDAFWLSANDKNALIENTYASIADFLKTQ